MHHRYSRLIGADEGSTLQAFKTICAEPFDPTIAAHNGRLVIDALNRSSICAQGETEAGPVRCIHHAVRMDVGK